MEDAVKSLLSLKTKNNDFNKIWREMLKQQAQYAVKKLTTK
jgi:hypothetical protein